MFVDLAVMLSPDLTVIRWDQRGCGRSSGRGPYSIARTVADLDTVRAHFGLERMAVFGHSWGADVALRYALDHPDRVDRLVYCAGVGLGRAWHEPYQRNLADRLGPDLARWKALSAERSRTGEQDRELAILQWTADFADPATARAHAERMATPWFEINHECNTTMDRLDEVVVAAECRTLPVPTLILDGAQDIRPRWAVDSLERVLPVVTRITLDVGHVPWLEAPGEVRDALAAYLSGEHANC